MSEKESAWCVPKTRIETIETSATSDLCEALTQAMIDNSEILMAGVPFVVSGKVTASYPSAAFELRQSGSPRDG